MHDARRGAAFDDDAGARITVHVAAQKRPGRANAEHDGADARPPDLDVRDGHRGVRRCDAGPERRGGVSDDPEPGDLRIGHVEPTTAASDSAAAPGKRMDAPFGTRLRRRTPLLSTRRSRYSPGWTRISVPAPARAIAATMGPPAT